ncbi:MAG: GDSL-type esterase/lipase family protein [Gemmatimonadales bacterium]
MTEIRRRELLLAWVLLGCFLVPDFLEMGTRARVVTALPWLLVAGVLLSPLASRVSARTRQLFADARITGAMIVCWAGLFLAAVAVLGPFGGVFLAVWGIASYVLAALLLPARSIAAVLVAATLVVLLACSGALAAEGLLRTSAAEERYGGPEAARRFFSAESDRLWSHNLFGFRSPYERVARAPGVWRIVALGAGYTSAEHIARTDGTWPALLERELRRRYPGRSIEVINMGRAGYTVANIAELFHRLAWQFEPDLVVVEFEPNEARTSRPDFGNAPLSRLRLTILPDPFRRGWLASSALLYFAEYRYHIHVYDGLGYREYLPFFKDGAEGYRQTLSAVRHMGDSARIRGTPVVLMLFPDLIPGTWSSDSDPFQPVYRRLAEVGADAGMTVLDLQPVFIGQRLDGRHWWAAPYSSNPNEEAYRLAARSLADLIVKCDWLGGPSPQPSQPPRACPSRSSNGTVRNPGDTLPR